MAGNALANATAAPTISRRDACRRVEEFLARARSVNSDDSWLHRIGKVVVFGSYLNNQDRIGHIDLAIRLERRAKVDEDWVEAVLNVAEAAERRGHRFRGFVDRLAEKLGRILACLSCK
jgi:predicted nucleotidyltransferase